MILRAITLVALYFGLSATFSSVYSQAFSTFNNRNHPEIEWVESETTHFKIIYGKHLNAALINEAAHVAEETYSVLSKSLGIEFDRKIRIYLSDEDEITNGAALFLNDGYTFIWVELNEFPDTFSGDKKWIRTVVAHELAHLFNFEAVNSNMGIWGLVFGNSGSRSLTEGYAQYATEFWNAQRGDRWLRSAIFNDRPSEFDGSTPYNGYLIYAKGFSQLLYIADQYGDSTVAKMFAWRDTLVLNLTYPDVYKGFEKATGEKWSDFENRWLKHMNIYYNTLASQMDRTDSLKGKKIEMDGLLMFDFKASPSGKKAVASAYHSTAMPVYASQLLERDSTGFKVKKTLFLGGKNPDFHWSNDEKKLYFSINDRAENSSLVNDVYSYSFETGKIKRITYNARVAFPVETKSGEILAIQNQDGTGNVVRIDPKTGKISNFTSFSGDTQVLFLTINHQRNTIAYTKVDALGNRTIETIDLNTKETGSFTQGNTDDKNPIFSPDGKYLAFNSLRDNVPNVFVADLSTKAIERGTFVFTGAEIFDWVAGDSLQASSWIIKSIEHKSKEQFLQVADTFRTTKSVATAPEVYSSWTTASPKTQIAANFDSKSPITQPAKEYSHLKNVGHFLSIGLPYYEDNSVRKDYGLQGFTSWADPLGKHNFIAFGNLSFVNQENTYGIAQYVNNTLSFKWSIDAYRFPTAIQFYDDNLLVSTMAGFGLTVSQDLDWKPRSYSYSRYLLTTRGFKWEPGASTIYSTGNKLNFGDAWQNDIIAAYEVKHVLPYVHNDIHPLKAYGANISLKTGINASNKWFGNNQNSFAIVDFRWFDVRKVFKEITLYTSFRAQKQFGNPLPFESVQLSRFDNFNLPVVGQVPLSTWNAPDRVRGFRNFILSDELYFSSSELRAPLLPSLGTKILGLFSLDKTTIAVFSDIAFANNINQGALTNSVWQWGLGGEVKNKLTLFGVLPIIHSVGLAQPHSQLFKSSNYDVYYRIQGSIPF